MASEVVVKKEEDKKPEVDPFSVDREKVSVPLYTNDWVIY